MKATELQIGDWVIFHDSGYASDGTTWEENRVCQIDSIDEDVRVKWYDESGYKEDWPHVSTVLLSPIPLTPDILEKNGFYYDEDRKAYLMGVIFRVKPERYGLFSFEICGCPYPLNTVHELQHALRLCGIEKEIEL